MNSFLKYISILLFLSIPLFANMSKSIFVSYESTPERVYIGEVFPVTLKAIITRDDYNSITTSLNNNQNFKILNENSSWTKNLTKGYFTNTFYLQALKKTVKLASLKIVLNRQDQALEQDILDQKDIEVIQLNADKKFSKVVAQSFAVKTVATSRFDNDKIIVTLFIEATLSNLDEFSLSFATKENIDLFSQRVLVQSIQYNAIVPEFVNSFDFTYFNTKTHTFESVNVPITLQSDDISTHTDINPKENKLKLYKDILLGLIAIASIVFFIWKKKKVFVFIAILLFVYLFYANNPFNKIQIKDGSSIQVLPTEHSTVFFITKNTLVVEKLDSTEKFYKIILPDGKIGWVERENVIKD